MTRESLDIILRLWSDEGPFHHEGKFWTIDKPDRMNTTLVPHLKPVQAPHPPIGVAGLSPNSSTLKLAGERGFLPMSLNLNNSYVKSHWTAYEEGARSTAVTTRRSSWRVVREIFVAETDEEAHRLSAGSMMGRMMDEYLLPLLKDFQFIHYLKHDEAVTDSDVTAEYCARHNWLIGSPATVAQKLEAMWNEVGGFGTLLVLGFDYADAPDVWYNSLKLLAQDVLPRVKHLHVE
jgi:alkanesulfonate monooxygenase SsuD/methylene tetrahydromethanopterin reductase-like flavin-dependent oxidoreductase (luciferase family)